MERSTRKFWDRMLLAGSALLVCVTTGASFLLGDIYHINPAWLFLAWNSILLLLSVGRGFRGSFKNPYFIVFFVAWMSVHGAVVVSLMRWVRMLYWIPLMAAELFIGYVIANWLFGILPDIRK